MAGGIGWFASAREICRAQSYLGQLSQRDVNTDALLRNAMVVENGVLLTLASGLTPPMWVLNRPVN